MPAEQELNPICAPRSEQRVPGLAGDQNRRIVHLIFSFSPSYTHRKIMKNSYGRESIHRLQYISPQ